MKECMQERRSLHQIMWRLLGKEGGDGVHIRFDAGTGIAYLKIMRRRNGLS